jgi:hypothetical protein
MREGKSRDRAARWQSQHEEQQRIDEPLTQTQQLPPAAHDLIGWCRSCQRFRLRSECRQVLREECCLYACRTCNTTIDESGLF